MLLLLVNHFKSKGFGTQAESNERRLRQAERVRAIYDTLFPHFPEMTEPIHAASDHAALFVDLTI